MPDMSSFMVKKYLVLLVLLVFLTVLLFQNSLYGPDKQLKVSKVEKDSGEIRSSIKNELRDTITKLDRAEFQRILKPILVERVVGTDSHEFVKEFIAAEMKRYNWTVEFDAFQDKTPNMGTLLFTNVIAVLKPNAARHLVFGCHYDSKLMDFKFTAATDSAVPCAMMVYLARIMTTKILNTNANIGLKFIFFDGEEAFESWTDQDSLYGARHLADRMERTAFKSDTVKNANLLHNIDLLVLLDLLGSENPTFYNYFSKTTYWYNALVQIETKLGELGLLDFRPGRKHRYFIPHNFYEAKIADDHVPFMTRGVPVLHIIPYPFPRVWHTALDNENAIHLPTVNNLLMIFELFIAQYLSEERITSATEL